MRWPTVPGGYGALMPPAAAVPPRDAPDPSVTAPGTPGDGATRWLDPREQGVWRSYLEGTQRLWDHLGAVHEAAAEVSLQEYEVLVRLSEADDGGLRMSQLAYVLVHSRSRLTHTVGRMEIRGLVERRASPDDGRGVLCVITDEGRAALERTAPLHVTGVREVLVDVLRPDELDALGAALEKVAARLRG
ncbi:MarR family transcriptional regulator [Pseudokineococcus lusitanus]|uniref:MarR family transcriptional regulator n=2 Tax=Pseudokineococcus lusitanus TaxID=763993 RepID=A0A3N1HL83_9ACTN|nr:MarR family transcriptional regulator [Pseudokineococcus lusitanus]